jgi:hypothetical protein
MNADDVEMVLANAHAGGHIMMGPNRPPSPDTTTVAADSADAIVGEGIFRKWTHDVQIGGLGHQAAAGVKSLIDSITSLEQRVTKLEGN